MIRILSSIGTIAGAILVILLIALALFPSVLTEFDPMVTDIGTQLTPPSQQHPFGTDNLGRDIQARLLYGLGESLGVSAIAMLMALIVGGVLGIAAGWFGEVVNNAVVSFARFLSAGPSILLMIVIAATGGGKLIIAMGIAVVLLPGFIRVFGGVASCIKNKDAVSSLGLAIARISLSMALAVLLYAGLGFLGFGVQMPQLGVQMPQPELGNMISAAYQYMREYPSQVLYPGLTLAAIALPFNILGESLNALLLSRETRKRAAAGGAELSDETPELSGAAPEGEVADIGLLIRDYATEGELGQQEQAPPIPEYTVTPLYGSTHDAPEREERGEITAYEPETEDEPDTPEREAEDEPAATEREAEGEPAATLGWEAEDEPAE